MDVNDELILRLAESVAATVSQNSTNDQRKQSFNLLEEFKQKTSAEQKIAIAEILIRNERLLWTAPVIHYALKVLEDVVRSGWSNLMMERKAVIKTCVTNLITSSTGKMDLTDGIARVLVEIIKRENSKDWPQILKELEALSEKGPSELCIVSVIVLRLTDDIYRFRDGPSNTQRDRLESFKNAMADFIPFLIRSLTRSSQQPQLRNIAHNFLQICSTIAECAPVKFLWNQEGKLLDVILLQLIHDSDSLQLEIAEFLCNILERRHPKAGNIFLLSQFLGKSAYFNAILRHVQFAGPFNETNYKTYKRFCEVYSGLAFQLSVLEVIPDWVSEKLTTESPLQQYMRVLFQMTNHQSPVICSIALNAWTFLLGHRVFPHLPDVKIYAQPLLQTSLNLFLLHDLTPRNRFLELDFMRQVVEFREFLLAHRARIVDVLRKIRKICPRETLEFALASLKLLVERKEDNLEAWSAMHYVLSNSMQPGKNADGAVPSVRLHLITTFRPLAFQLLNQLIVLDSSLKPAVVSVRLSCLSKLTTNFLPRVENDPDDIVRRNLLVKIYAFMLQLIKDTATANKSDSTTRELHLHARNSLNCLCRNITDTLVECYEEITRMTIEILSTGNGIFSVMDRCALLEGLIILARGDEQDSRKKNNLLHEIMAAVSPIWQSPVFAAALKSPAEFVGFFGLDQIQVDGAVFVERRQQLSFCSAIIAATVMNIRFSEPELMRLLENAFSLLGSVLGLYEGKMLDLMPKENRRIVLELPESERLAVLKPLFGELADSTKIGGNIARSQNWLQSNFENACRIIGFAGRCFSSLFYDVPNLTSVINSVIATNLRHNSTVPLFRLRTLIREFLPNYMRYCPENRVEGAVIPVLVSLCPVITKVLIHHWNADLEEKTEQEEILEENLRQGFSSDYANLVIQRMLCEPAKVNNSQCVTVEEDVEMLDDNNEESGKVLTKNNKGWGEVSRMGMICLQTPELAESILLTVFGALSWREAQLALRYTQFAQMIVGALLKLDRLPLKREGAVYVMRAVLAGLKIHGHLENNQTPLVNLAMTAYVNLKPRYPEEVVRAFFTEPDQPPVSFENLDSVLFPKPGGKISNDKFKREAFKKFFEGTVKFLGDSSRQQLVVVHNLVKRSGLENSGDHLRNGFVIDDNLNLPLLFG